MKVFCSDFLWRRILFFDWNGRGKYISSHKGLRVLKKETLKKKKKIKTKTDTSNMIKNKKMHTNEKQGQCFWKKEQKDYNKNRPEMSVFAGNTRIFSTGNIAKTRRRFFFFFLCNTWHEPKIKLFFFKRATQTGITRVTYLSLFRSSTILLFVTSSNRLTIIIEIFGNNPITQFLFLRKQCWAMIILRDWHHLMQESTSIIIIVIMIARDSCDGGGWERFTYNSFDSRCGWSGGAALWRSICVGTGGRRGEGSKSKPVWPEILLLMAMQQRFTTTTISATLLLFRWRVTIITIIAFTKSKNESDNNQNDEKRRFSQNTQ